MGLFGKKEKKTCVLCGGSIGMFDTAALSDESAICEKCASFTQKWCPLPIDEISRETAEEISRLQLLDEEDYRDEFDTEGDMTAYMRVFKFSRFEDAAGSAVDMYGDRYSGTMAALGIVLFGNFNEQDGIKLVCGETQLDATVINCTEATEEGLEDQLEYSRFEGMAYFGSPAWIILKADGLNTEPQNISGIAKK